MADDLLLTVTNVDEPDVIHGFVREGQRRYFGRDDENCDIVVWSAINGRDLSRIAGCIWRMEDELWVRNLSTHHEVFVHVPGRPLDPPLPPRRRDGRDRGPAQAIPAGLAFIRAPGGCNLLVRQQRAVPTEPGRGAGEITHHALSVPEDLLPVAAALCEPLLAGGQLPATYAQVTQRAGLRSLKSARTRIAKLTCLYAGQVPVLGERVAERRRREADALGISAEPELRAGVRAFPARLDAHPGAAGRVEEDERRRALTLPDYYELAHFLVRRGLVTEADLGLLAEGS